MSSRPIPRPGGGTLPHRLLVRRLIAAGLTVFAGTPALAGCQGQDASDALDRVKRAGRLVIATDALYPPNEFKQGGAIVGFDVDLGAAIARELGVDAEFQDVKFSTILTALGDGKYDISLSSFTDTRERERRFDFVTYLAVGTTLLVRKGNPGRLRPDDLSLCGRRIAVEKGTTQEDELSRKTPAAPASGTRLDACRGGHRPAPIRLSFDDQAAANGALATGHADAVLADTPSAVYGAKAAADRIEVSGSPYAIARYGVAVPKHHTDVRDAVHEALEDLMGDGTYRRLLARWGISDGAVGEPKINTAG